MVLHGFAIFCHSDEIWLHVVATSRKWLLLEGKDSVELVEQDFKHLPAKNHVGFWAMCGLVRARASLKLVEGCDIVNCCDRF